MRNLTSRSPVRFSSVLLNSLLMFLAWTLLHVYFYLYFLGEFGRLDPQAAGASYFDKIEGHWHFHVGPDLWLVVLLWAAIFIGRVSVRRSAPFVRVVWQSITALFLILVAASAVVVIPVASVSGLLLAVRVLLPTWVDYRDTQICIWALCVGALLAAWAACSLCEAIAEWIRTPKAERRQ